MRINCIQALIDKIRRKTGTMTTLADKYIGIKRNPNVKTLILGSSHLMFGYLPSENEYNLAFPSQDLYSSYELYKLFNNKNIENIVISFSVFTPGQKLCLGSVADASAVLKVIYGIEYQHPELIDKEKMNKREHFYKTEYEKYLKKIKLNENYRGDLLRHGGMKTSEKHIKNMALKHFKNNTRENNNMPSCIDLINATKENGQKLYFILPPATDCYKNSIPGSEVLFKKLYDIVENQPHVKVLNFYDSADIAKSDFYDGDHLKPSGAKKLTQAIHEIIYKP